VYRLDPRRLRPADAHLRGPGHALLSTRFADLDVLGTIFADTSYEGLIADTIEMELADVVVCVLTLERLIEAKEFTGRPKDLAALPALRAALALGRKG
jgi:hypothetical protein